MVSSEVIGPSNWQPQIYCINIDTRVSHVCNHVFCSHCWLLSSCISSCDLWKSKRQVATLVTCSVWGQVILPIQLWLPMYGISLLMRMRMWGKRGRRWKNINQDKQDPWVTESHGPPITKRFIVKSREISSPRDRMYDDRIALIFDRHLHNASAEVPVNLKSDWENLNHNLAAPGLHEI